MHNCEMKKSFNFDKVSFLSEQPEKSTDFLSSFLETQVGFHESYLHLNPSVESKVPNPLVEATKILWFGGSIQLKFNGIFLKIITSLLHRLSTIKYRKSELAISTI